MIEAYRHPEALVDGEWLEANLGDPSLRVFDCTTYLDPPSPGTQASYDVRSGFADHQAGHIPGAGFLDLQGELSDLDCAPHLRFTMPTPETLAAALGRRGIGHDTRVIVYSRSNMQWASRVWWMLRAIGFDNAAILDGGFDKWVLDARPVDTSPCSYAPAVLTPYPRPELFADRDEVLGAIDNASICTINALSADLHSGESPRYGRPGRIPGSVNLPAVDLQAPQTRILAAPADARAQFENIGAKPSERIIVYCGGGIAATLDAYLLVQLGYDNVAVYDASMSEWARDETLPVEVG
jgi:thiosulfate/3-mercaptopyruvate sulfurtransferase